jgi:putative transposase
MPAASAASSLVIPCAIPNQNRWSSDRFAAGGRPREGSGARPERWDRRFRSVIATSYVQVLRRSFESAQYTSVAFGARCKEAGVRPSTGSVGDAYDNAMCESFFATLECELIDRRRFRSHSEARMAVFQFIEGFYNPSRRHSALGYLSPIEYERKHDGLTKPA